MNEKVFLKLRIDNLEVVLPETDVLYVTRVQKERFEDQAEYENVKGTFVITAETMQRPKSI